MMMMMMMIRLEEQMRESEDEYCSGRLSLEVCRMKEEMCKCQ